MQNFYRNRAKNTEKQKHYTKMLASDIAALIVVTILVATFLFFAIITQ